MRERSDRSVQIEQARLDLLLPAERQQLTCDGSGPLGGAPDFFDVGVSRMRRCKLTECELGVSGDRGERIVEIVCDTASQLTQRLHLLTVPQLFLEFQRCGGVGREVVVGHS